MKPRFAWVRPPIRACDVFYPPDFRDASITMEKVCRGGRVAAFIRLTLRSGPGPKQFSIPPSAAVEYTNSCTNCPPLDPRQRGPPFPDSSPRRVRDPSHWPV